jgi:hypothetical protein
VIGRGELAGEEDAPLASEVTKAASSGWSDCAFVSAAVGVEFASTGNLSHGACGCVC